MFGSFCSGVSCVAVDMGTVGVPQGVIRRRLSSKTTVARGAGFDAPSQPTLLPVVDGETSAGTAENSAFAFARDKILWNAYAYWWRRKVKFASLSPSVKARYARKYNLRLQSPARRDELMQSFFEAHPHLERRSLYRSDRRAVPDTCCRRSNWVTESCLLTWIGEFGDIPVAQVLNAGGEDAACFGATSASGVVGVGGACATSARSSGGRVSGAFAEMWAAADPDADLAALDMVAGRVSQHATVQSIRSEFGRVSQLFAKWHELRMHAWSLEVCPRAWADEGRIRVHVHAAFVLQKRQCIARLDEICMFGVRPFATGWKPGVVGAGRAAAALYYCQVKKVGQVDSGGTHVPWLDYHVSPSWVTTLVASRKISVPTARSETLKSPAYVDKGLANLALYERSRREAAVARVMAEQMRIIQAQMAPCVSLPAVHLWENQFASPAPRYKFLVLTGPSQTGKTIFARGLARTGDVLELSLAGDAGFDMRLYNPLQHEVIILDEASPSQIVAQKKLMQASPAMITLQTSATNIMAISVCVAGKKFVVCSNRWVHDVACMPVVDAMWLAANSVVVEVNAPLWAAA